MEPMDRTLVGKSKIKPSLAEKLDTRANLLLQSDAKQKLLLIGNCREASNIALNINAIAKDYCVVGCLKLNNREPFLEGPNTHMIIHGDFSELVPFLEMIPRNVSAIVIADPEVRHHQVLQIITLARKCDVKVWMIPQLANAFTGDLRFTNFYGHPIVKIRNNRIPPIKQFVKNSFDYLMAGGGLLVSAPIMLLAAFLIKLTSPGPVLFKQTRAGKNGRLFNVIKFRSMYADAEKNCGPVLSSTDDNRVTPLGKILRKTHIDELPQFFNVLNGSMSLVGPRPERPYFIEGFAQRIPFYSDRLAVKPGITGLAQVYGNYHSKAEEKLIFDLNYIHNCNLLLDFKLCVLTAWQACKSLIFRKEKC